MFPGPRGCSRSQCRLRGAGLSMRSLRRAKGLRERPGGSSIAPRDDRRRASPGWLRQGPALQGAGVAARVDRGRVAGPGAGRQGPAPRGRRRHRSAGRLPCRPPEGGRRGHLSLPRADGRPPRAGPLDGRLLRRPDGHGDRGHDPRRGAARRAGQGAALPGRGPQAVPRGGRRPGAQGAGAGAALRLPRGPDPAAAQGAHPGAHRRLGGVRARAGRARGRSRGREAASSGRRTRTTWRTASSSPPSRTLSTRSRRPRSLRLQHRLAEGRVRGDAAARRHRARARRRST